MRKSLQILALTLAAAIGGSGVLLASERHGDRFGADAPLVYKATDVGTVQSITDGKLVLRTEAGKQVEVAVTERTKVENAAGDRVQASTLAAGQRLEVIHRGEKVIKIEILAS